MIDVRNGAVLAGCLLLAAAGYWWVSGEATEFAMPGSEGANTEGQAGAQEQGTAATARLEKAILACLLAASYGAERGARIDQAEKLIRDLGFGGAGLDADGRREFEALKAALPGHRKERDASYALYFRGIEALAGASGEARQTAFASVDSDLSQAGLRRLVRYIPAIRQHIAASGTETRSSTRNERWIKELKDAVQQ